MDIEIEKVALQDAAAISDILRGLGFFPHLASETPGRTQARVTKHLKLCLADGSHSIYVARLTEEGIVGYVAVHWLPYLMLPAPEGYISELFVKDTARGRGVGAALLETAKREARDRGCYRLMLLNLRTRESYQRGFYAKQGWQERPEAATFIYLF